MTVKIQNEFFVAEIDLYGGKLVSLLSRRNGTEYIWRDTSVYWPDRACLLFPTSGRLYGGKYTHRGKSYGLPLHGFAYTSEFGVTELTDNSVTLILTDNPDTFKLYPFRFRFAVTYELEGNALKVRSAVTNTGDETMYFALGFHPWFNVPSDETHAFVDYRAEFPYAAEIKVCKMSENVLDSGERIPLGSDHIDLCPSLFESDALMLEGTGGEVRITCGYGGLKIDYEKMPYLGLWNTAEKNAHFLCVETMTALPGREGVIEEWSGRDDIIALAASETYDTSLTIAEEDDRA